VHGACARLERPGSGKQSIEVGATRCAKHQTGNSVDLFTSRTIRVDL
jgi:hypothetical protein